ncbi:MAG TPA: hypothetical protein VF085_02910 [Solirubrobacterales bacterium]
MRSAPITDRPGWRNSLLDRFADAITVEGGRRDGSAETRIRLDLRHPDVADSPDKGFERWRLRTARHRLARAPFSRETLTAFHAAEAQKGRRLIAVDLQNDSRVAALMAWHFEARPAQDGSRRPHLVVALGPAQDADGALRAEYLVACWLLCLIGLAIDRRTVAKGCIGVVLDTAIALPKDELGALGFRRGSQRNGYSGDYFELPA